MICRKVIQEHCVPSSHFFKLPQDINGDHVLLYHQLTPREPFSAIRSAAFYLFELATEMVDEVQIASNGSDGEIIWVLTQRPIGDPINVRALLSNYLQSAL